MSKEDILEAIAGMSVLDLSELISEMEEKFGVSAAAAVAVAAPGGAADGAALWLDPLEARWFHGASWSRHHEPRLVLARTRDRSRRVLRSGSP